MVQAAQVAIDAAHTAGIGADITAGFKAFASIATLGVGLPDMGSLGNSSIGDPTKIGALY